MKHSIRFKVLTEFFRVILGLLIFAYGVHLTIAAGIGLAPWDCLGMGIAGHTPLNYGLAMTTVSVIVLIIDILLGEPIGCGMIFDALLTGNFTNFFNEHCLLPDLKSIFGGIYLLPACVMIIVGLFFMAYGMYIYMSAGQSCGPRDSMLVGLGKRFPKISIGLVQNGLLITVLIIGFLLGGKVGIGTVISTFGNGIILNFVFRLCRFEPRDVKHKNVFETTALLLKGGALNKSSDPEFN
ncbi:MAG: hypothetical protein Q4E57_05435 [Eubacteriales bacterium]|nr:hypothetical protein [Eubacteriales bacterium]